MDGFTYTDIFETKGIEYLIIISFLVMLILFWIILNKQTSIAKRIHRAFGALTANLLRIPQGLFYSKTHTWAYLEKSGNAKVGLDDFLLQIVGDVKVNHLKFPGEKIRKGEILTEIDQNGKRLRIISPISGEVVDANSMIRENPEMLHEDPYGKGWIYAIKPSNWKDDIHSYYLAEEATQWITKDLDRFKDFLAVSISKHSSEPSMIAFQEGGELRQNILSELDNKIWEDFQESFLS
jgi:glycine cleavage system H protein